MAHDRVSIREICLKVLPPWPRFSSVMEICFLFFSFFLPPRFFERFVVVLFLGRFYRLERKKKGLDKNEFEMYFLAGLCQTN